MTLLVGLSLDFLARVIHWFHDIYMEASLPDMTKYAEILKNIHHWFKLHFSIDIHLIQDAKFSNYFMISNNRQWDMIMDGENHPHLPQTNNLYHLHGKSTIFKNTSVIFYTHFHYLKINTIHTWTSVGLTLFSDRDLLFMNYYIFHRTI